MRERWIDEVLDAPAPGQLRTEVDARLRAELSTMWSDDIVSAAPGNGAEQSTGDKDDQAVGGGGGRVHEWPLDVEERPERRTSGSRRWVYGLTAAALVAMIAGAVVVGGSDPDGGVDRGDGTVDGSTPASAGPATTVAPDPSGLKITGVTWLVTAVDEVQYDGPVSTFRFREDGTLSGNDGCNSYSAEFRLEGLRLTIPEGGATVVGCDEYGYSIAAGPIVVGETTLTGAGATSQDDADVTLTAVAVERLPASVDQITGTWERPSGAEVEFRDDGTVVSDDCPSEGTWRADGSFRVELRPSSACEPSQELVGRGGVLDTDTLLIADPSIGFAEQLRRTDVAVPVFVADSLAHLDVVVFATVPSDAFTSGLPLLAIFPDSVLVVRELFEDAEPPSLVGFEFDRVTGEKTGEFALVRPDGDRRRPLRVWGSSNGALYVQTGACSFLAYQKSAPGMYEVADRADNPHCGTDPRRTIWVDVDGLQLDGMTLLPPAGPVHHTARIEVDREPGALEVIRRETLDESERTWRVQLGSGADDVVVSDVGLLGDGIGIAFTSGSAPSTLVVLDDEPTAYGLSGWNVAGMDQAGVVLWRETANDKGIELGRLRN